MAFTRLKQESLQVYGEGAEEETKLALTSRKELPQLITTNSQTEASATPEANIGMYPHRRSSLYTNSYIN